jgi:fimbrial chaperone protein
MRNRLVIYAAGLVLLTGGLSSLWAGSFSVNPVRVDLSARELHATLRITNVANDKLTVQVQPMLWAFGGKEETLKNTNDLIVNPPIFTIAAHQTQFVRIGLRRMERMTVEQAYRLILEEVPPAPTPGFNGLRTILRISMPIFVRPSVPAEPILWWSLRNSPGKGTTLSVQNRGTAHVQLKHISISFPGVNRPVISHALSAYLLPGQQREWTFDDANLFNTESVSLEATTDTGPISENLTVRTP